MYGHTCHNHSQSPTGMPGLPMVPYASKHCQIDYTPAFALQSCCHDALAAQCSTTWLTSHHCLHHACQQTSLA
jgi:hypothetical protein